MPRRTIGSRRDQPARSGSFVGRAREQAQFRTTLRELARLRDVPDDDLPEDQSYAQVFLIAAEGGMGKSTLMRRFAELIAEDRDGAGALAVLIDLEAHHKHIPIGRNVERFLDVLHRAFCELGYEDDFAPFREARSQRNELHRRAASLAHEYRADRSQRRAADDDKEKELDERQLTAEGLHPAAELSDGQRAFFRRRLGEQDWARFDNAYALTPALIDCINSLATPERPVAVLLDTYEVADACDSWLREELLPQTGTRLVWAIAGRANSGWQRAYEDTLGGEVIGSIPLGVFAPGDIEAYLLAQKPPIEPAPELVERLNGLSRGVPLALAAWVDLHRKGDPLPEPDAGAARSYQEVVRTVTERFLRYCADDKLLSPVERQQRAELRHAILSLFLLRRPGNEALGAMWGCPPAEAERRLAALGDDFSFIFIDPVTREPHALVRQFIREDLRIAMPEVVRERAARLETFATQRLRQREARLLPDIPRPQPLSADERARLEARKAACAASLHVVLMQITSKGQADAGLGQISERDRLASDIAEIDRQLKAAQPDPAAITPRRPLWEDEEWCELLLDHLNALAWTDTKGEAPLQALVPLLLEAIHFNKPMAAQLFDTLDEFVGVWREKYKEIYNVLVKGRWLGDWYTTENEQEAIVHVLQSNTWRLEIFHQALLALESADAELRALLALESADAELRQKKLGNATQAIWKAASSLPLEEYGTRLGDLLGNIGAEYLWPGSGTDDAVPSPEALDVLHQAVKFNRKKVDIWYWLGTAQAKSKQYKESVVTYNHAISLEANNVYIYIGLGNVYHELEMFDEAINAYHQAINLDSKEVLAHNGLGNVYQSLGKFDKALAAYQQALEIDPSLAQIYYGLGNAYHELGQFEEAIEAYQQSLTINPTLLYALNGIGNVYQSLGRFDEAFAAYQQVIENNPMIAYAHTGLGNIYQELNQFQNAIVAYQQAINLDPEDVSAYYGLGNTYSLLGELDKAEEIYQKAIELDSTYYRVIAALARLSRERGNKTNAALWIDQARPLIPAYEFYNHACLDSIAGNVDTAIRLLQTALERKETSLEWARQDPDLQYIRHDPRYRALVGLEPLDEAPDSPSADNEP